MDLLKGGLSSVRELDRAHLPRASPTPKVRHGPHTSLVATKQCNLSAKGWA